jgi:hypothetical protein
MSPHVHIDFVVPPPGCGRSVTDVWGWGAHRAQLRCPDDVSDDMYERGVTGGALNLNCTGYPDHGRYGDLPVQGKIPTAEPGSSDHQSTRLVPSTKQYYIYVRDKQKLINKIYALLITMLSACFRRFSNFRQCIIHTICKRLYRMSN